MEGYLNIDIEPHYEPDLLIDLENPLPIMSNKVEEIVAEHILEHIHPANISRVIRELWRVSKSDGVIKIKVPIGRSWQKWPEHKTPFDDGSEEFFLQMFNDNKPMFAIITKKIEAEEMQLNLLVLK